MVVVLRRVRVVGVRLSSVVDRRAGRVGARNGGGDGAGHRTRHQASPARRDRGVAGQGAVEGVLGLVSARAGAALSPDATQRHPAAPPLPPGG